MSTDRHQDTSKNQSRIERVRQKLRLSEKAKTISAAFLEKRQRRLAWWQRTFRTPLWNSYSLFCRSQSFWLAFLSMIGRSPARQAGTANKSPARQAGPTRRTAVRQLIYEGLELRTMMATDLVSTILPSLVSSTGNNNSNGASISADGKLVAFSSAASNLINGDTNGTQDIFVRDLSSGAVTRVSTDAASVQSNGTSTQPQISADGKWVVFRSDASNLVPGDTNNWIDIFVKDLTTGAISRVSTNSASVQSNNDSADPTISADGKFVAFSSLASNLVASDTNNTNDIFVKDLTTGVMTRVSTNASSAQGSGSSFAPSISADGKLVAFHSNAGDLVTGDTNFTTDVFVKNRTTGAVTRVSTSSASVQGNNFSFHANISADGKMVAYHSYASNLVASDNNGSADVFVKDLATGLTTLVSTSSASVQGNGHSLDPSLSQDGKFITFSSRANNLVAGDSNSTYDIFVKDLVNGTTTRVSTNSASAQSNLESQQPSISSDGKVVAFESLASNLVAGDSNNSSDVFVKDLNSGVATSPSLRDFSLAVQLGGNDVSSDSSISADGNFVAFTSLASNLVASDTNGMNDVFVRNLGTGTTVTASTSSTLQQSTGDSIQPSISADGKLVAFSSNANNLVANDNNGSYDIFVKNLVTGSIERVSTDTFGSQSDGDSFQPSISANGKFVAFRSSASNLVGDGNGVDDIFVKNLVTGAISLVSTDSGGQQANFESQQPSISEDGRYVAFSSFANNLAGGDSNNNSDVFIKDTLSGTTLLVSSDSSFIPGNQMSVEPSISANGKLVAFRSASSDLVAGDSNGRDDIFIKDLSTGNTTRVSTDSLSVQANNDSNQPSINADGKFLAFRSSASNLVAGDTNGVDDIFVKNLSTGTLIRVSPNSLSVQGNGSSLDPSISGSGAFVAFNSLANNLHPNDSNTGSDVFRVSTIDNGEFAISITATDGAIAPENSTDTGTIRFFVSKASATPTFVWLDIPQNTPTNALFSDWTASLNNGASLTIGSESRSVINRSLLSDIVTLTTTTDHNYVVGQSIVVSGIGSAFDGIYTIATVPTSTTFTYARTGFADQVSAGLLGTVSTSSNALLSFPAGVTEVLMTLSAIGDSTVELDEAIDFKLATIKGPGGLVPPSLHIVGVPNAATVTIINDDVSVVTLAPNPISDLSGNDPDSLPSASFPNSGNDGQFVVQLSNPSSQNTVLTYSLTTPPAHGVQDFSTDFALGVPGAISTVNGGNGIVSVVNAGGANGNMLEMRRVTSASAMTSANSATLTVNLEAFKTTGGAVLTLDHVRLGNELVDNSFAGLGTADAFVSNPNVDGIAISTDGITYYPLLNLTSTANGIAINLERALYDRGLIPSSAVRIRFLQFDAGVANNLTDTGRRFDNIRVVSGDYAALSGTVTVPAGNVTAAINISVLNDLVVEGTENVSVTLTSLSSPIPNVSLDPISVNLTRVASITDSDSAVAVIEAAAYASEQLPANGLFRVRLTNGSHSFPMRSDSDTTITFELDPSFMPPAATYGVDYTLSGNNVTFDQLTSRGTIKILAGETQSTITVNVIQDTEVENDEWISIKLVNAPAFPIIGDPQILASLATASVGILDDKVALIRISSVAAGMEPSTNGTFVVDLVRTVDQVNVLQPVQQVISKVNTVVTYTVSGTAQPGVSAGNGNDYAQLTVLGTGTVTITAGQSSAFISVNVFDDLQLEPTETVIITLQGKLSGDASSIISPALKIATVNILDDDSYVLSIARTGSPPTEPGSIGAGGSDGQFTVTLTKTLPSPLIVVIEDVTTIGLGKAKLGTGAGADYNYSGSINKFQTVTIQPGQTQATMTITVLDDLVSEGDESIDVRIDRFIYAPDPGISILVIPDSVQATIVDNDVINVMISTTNGRDKIVGSDNGQFLFNTGGVTSLYDTFFTYSVRTAGSTATSGSDYTAIPAGSFLLTPGQTTAAILLQVLEDTEVEGDETVQLEVLTVTSAGPNPLSGAGNVGTATIIDEDFAKLKFAGSANASEPSGLGFFSIEQSAKSSTNTVIEFSITGGTATPQVDFTIPAPLSVTIAAGQTRAFIPVQALDDAMVEVGVETVQLTLASSTKLGDPQITVDGANRVATIDVIDADIAKVLFTKVQDGAEGVSNGIFNVGLVHATSLSPLRSDLNVIVTYEISGTSKGGASNTNLVNGPDYQQFSVSRIGTLTIPALQTSASIGVTVFDDDFVESLENVTIRQLSVTTASPRAISLNTQSAVVTAKSDFSGAFATLTANNNFIAGQQVVIAIGDPAFDGTFQIISATSSNFSYFKGNSTAVPNATPASGVAAITTPVGISTPVSSQILGQSLTGNVATIFTSGAHGLLPGQIVTIALAQASTTYDGTFVLLPGTAGTTLFYSRSLADQPGSTFTGTVFNRSNANMLISDNDSSTLTFNSASIAEGNQIFEQSGPNVILSLSKAYDIPTTWTVNYAAGTNAAVAITSRELTNDVATIFTNAPGPFLVGQKITVAMTVPDPVFAGQYLISAVNPGVSISYARSNANVASIGLTGIATVSGAATPSTFPSFGDNILGTDFDGKVHSVTIPAGALSGSVKFEVNEEGLPNSPQINLVEDDEFFLISVSGGLPSGYTITNTGAGIVRILNDDTVTYTINDAQVDEPNPIVAAFTLGTTRELNSNLVTFTMPFGHGLVSNQTIEVKLGDPVFDGRFAVTVLNPNQFTYVKTNGDVLIAAAVGTITTFPQASLVFTISANNPVDIAINLLVSYTDTSGVLGAVGANYLISLPIPAGTDYNSANGSATFPSFNSGAQVGSQTVSVQVNSDLIVEGGTVNNPGSETFTAGTAIHPNSFAVIPPGGRLFNNKITGIGSIRDAVGTNADTASVTISVIDGLGAETNPAGLNQAVYKILQSNPSTVDTIIKLNIAAGGDLNATQGSDYLLRVGSSVVTDTVTIPAGSTEIILTVDVLNDPILEDDEFVDITLSSFVSRDPNVGFGVNTNGKIQINDNDNAQLSVSASDPIGSEPGTDDAAFTVSLTALSDTDTVVSYHVLGSLEAGFKSPAATAGSDYVALSGSVTIPAFSLSAVILVDVLNDFVAGEGTEYVSIKLDSIIGNADIGFGSPVIATIEIQDDVDGLFVKIEKVKDGSEPGIGPQDGQFKVTLVSALGVPVVLPIGSTGGAGGLQVDFALNEVGSGGTAVSPTDYINATVVVIPEGSSTAFVTIDVQDDLIVEPTETVKIRLVGTSPTFILRPGPATELVSIATGVPVYPNIGNALYPNLASLDILDNDGSVSSFVVSRGLFYNNSSYDGNGAAIDTSGPTYDDFNAIAVDKNALLPGGTASFINYTSYSRGINGIIVDIAGLASTPTFATVGNYFQFRVGNGNTAPNTWAPAPGISSVTVLPSVGNSGSTRVLVTWADNAIQKQWLQVIVLANASTGLATRDVHYWGNAIGETGTILGNFAIVDSTDALLANSSPSGFVLQPVTNLYDFNRDKIVNSTDVLIANSNPSGFNPLVLFTAPASGSGGEGEVASMMVLSPIPTNNSMPMIGSRLIEVEEDQVYGPVQSSAAQSVVAKEKQAESTQLAMIIDEIAKKSAATPDIDIGSLDLLFGEDVDLFGMSLRN